MKFCVFSKVTRNELASPGSKFLGVTIDFLHFFVKSNFPLFPIFLLTFEIVYALINGEKKK